MAYLSVWEEVECRRCSRVALVNNKQRRPTTSGHNYIRWYNVHRCSPAAYMQFVVVSIYSSVRRCPCVPLSVSVVLLVCFCVRCLLPLVLERHAIICLYIALRTVRCRYMHSSTLPMFTLKANASLSSCLCLCLFVCLISISLTLALLRSLSLVLL